MLPMSLYKTVTDVYNPYRAAFFWLLFWAVKKSNPPGRAEPADLD
jgi:hypothetical protein